MNEKLKPFAYFANEKGDFTVVYEPNSENELVVTYVKKEERANATCDNLNKLWNTRTLSGQGKMPMSREDIEKFIYANERQLWNYTHDISGECCIGSNTVRKLLLSLHTAQPAPVSVEEIVEALEKIGAKSRNYASGLWFSHQDLRECIVNLFNAK